MKRTAILAAAALLVAASLSASDTAQTFRYNTHGLTRVSIDHPVGDVIVKGVDGEIATVTMTIRCTAGDCAEKTKNIHLVSSMSAGELVLDVKGFPKHANHGLEVDIDASLPRGLAIMTDHGVGDVEINGMLANITVDAGVGDVHITSPASAYKHASVDAGVGSVKFTVNGREAGEKHGFVGTELTWNSNQGRSAIDLDLGVGSATIRLE